MNPKKSSKILGIIATIYAPIAFIISSIILIFLVLVITQSAITTLPGFSFQRYYFQVLKFSFFLIVNLLWFISGIALIKCKKCARKLVIITAILSFIYFPFGTVMGLVFGGFMFTKKIKEYYTQNSLTRL